MLSCFLSEKKFGNTAPTCFEKHFKTTREEYMLLFMFTSATTSTV